MSDSSKRKCPDCGKLKLERLIGTGAAVIFKGSGFYETDYRSEGYKKAAKADSNGGKKSESESKPAKTDKKGGGGEKKADAKPPKPSSDSKPGKKG